MIKSFHRACVAAKVPEVRVSGVLSCALVCDALYRRPDHPRAAAEMLMHAPDSKMIDRCTIVAVEPRLKLAADACNRGQGAGMAVSRGWHTKGKEEKTA